MPDKMMRMAGRSRDGVARALETDENGRLQMTIAENIIHEPIKVVENFTTTPRIGQTLLASYEVSDATSIAFGIVCKTGDADIDIMIEPIIEGFVTRRVETLLLREKFTEYYMRTLTKKYNLRSPHFRVKILDYSEEPNEFDVYLYKFNTPTSEPVQMEHYGLSEDGLPFVSVLPFGSMFMFVDTQQVYQNDGSNWRLI